MTTTAASPTGTRTARPSAAVASLVLVAWTLFVWVGRVRNIVADDALEGWSQVWRLGLALTFVGQAIAVLTAMAVWRYSAGRSGASDLDPSEPPTMVRITALSLAGLGIVVWAVRGTDIALGDHSAAFIAVHTVLAVVTIALGVLVVLRVRPTGGAPG